MQRARLLALQYTDGPLKPIYKCSQTCQHLTITPHGSSTESFVSWWLQYKAAFINLCWATIFRWNRTLIWILFMSLFSLKQPSQAWFSWRRPDRSIIRISFFFLYSFSFFSQFLVKKKRKEKKRKALCPDCEHRSSKMKTHIFDQPGLTVKRERRKMMWEPGMYQQHGWFSKRTPTQVRHTNTRGDAPATTQCLSEVHERQTDTVIIFPCVCARGKISMHILGNALVCSLEWCLVSLW